MTMPASETSATTPTTSPTTSATSPTTSATSPTTSVTSPITSPTSATSPTTSPADTPLQVPTGPITRSRAKKIQQEVHALLCEFQLNIDGNFELPKSCMLLLLRFSEKEDKDTSRMDQREELRSSQPSMTEPSRRNSHIFCLPKAMKVNEYLLERS